jgi:hypothetical protein
MTRADLVRDHDRPPSSSRHDPGSTASSGPLARLVSPSEGQTTPAYRWSWSLVLLRTDRSAEARGVAPASVSSGVAWTSPRFWSRKRLDAPESRAFDGAKRSLNASRTNSASAMSADRSTWASAATRTVAQADRSNIHAGISSQRSTSEPPTVQRKTTSPDLSIARERQPEGQTMDATGTAVRETQFRGCS